VKKKRAKEGQNSPTLNLPCGWALRSGRTDRSMLWSLEEFIWPSTTAPSSSSQFLYICVRSVNLNTIHYVLVQCLPFKGLPYVKLTLLKQLHATEFHNFHFDPFYPMPSVTLRREEGKGSELNVTMTMSIPKSVSLSEITHYTSYFIQVHVLKSRCKAFVWHNCNLALVLL